MRALAIDVALASLGLGLAMQGGALPIGLAVAIASGAVVVVVMGWRWPRALPASVEVLALVAGLAAAHIAGVQPAHEPGALVGAGAATVLLLLAWPARRALRAPGARGSVLVALVLAAVLIGLFVALEDLLAPGLLRGAGVRPLWSIAAFVLVALAVRAVSVARPRFSSSVVAVALAAAACVSAWAPTQQPPLDSPSTRPFIRRDAPVQP